MLALVFSVLAAAGSSVAVDDAALRQYVIEQSITAYPGNCPCPYSRAANGSLCGRRSAYSKPGGYEPICYDSDVTRVMLEQARRNLGR